MSEQVARVSLALPLVLRLCNFCDLSCVAAQDNGPGWQIARLTAVADLLQHVPASCTALALNAGAAESLIGLHELARHGLASIRRRASAGVGALPGNRSWETRRACRSVTGEPQCRSRTVSIEGMQRSCTCCHVIAVHIRIAKMCVPLVQVP